MTEIQHALAFFKRVLPRGPARMAATTALAQWALAHDKRVQKGTEAEHAVAAWVGHYIKENYPDIVQKAQEWVKETYREVWEALEQECSGSTSTADTGTGVSSLDAPPAPDRRSQCGCPPGAQTEGAPYARIIPA
jgi:hypothetical protein